MSVGAEPEGAEPALTHERSHVADQAEQTALRREGAALTAHTTQQDTHLNAHVCVSVGRVWGRVQDVFGACPDLMRGMSCTVQQLLGNPGRSNSSAHDTL